MAKCIMVSLVESQKKDIILKLRKSESMDISQK